MNVQDASEFVMNHIRRADQIAIPIRIGSMGVCPSSDLGAWVLNQFPTDKNKVGVCGMGAVALGRKLGNRNDHVSKTVATVMALSELWISGFTDGFDRPDDPRDDYDVTAGSAIGRTQMYFGLAAGLTVRQMCWLEGIEVHQ